MSELEANRTKWSESGVKSYQFDFSLACFCGFTDMPIRIVVRDGAVESMMYASGITVPPGFDRATFAHYSTVELAFANLDAEIHSPTRSVEATFDPQYGFPAKVHGDSYASTDSATYLSIENFEVLS